MARRRLRFLLTPISWLALLTIASYASAQDIFVTPIPGTPFTGVVNVERSVVQLNGSTVSFTTMRNIGRDSRGRIHNEARALLPVSGTETPEIVRIHLYDPQTRISTILDAHTRTFSTMTVNRPPSAVPPSLVDASPTGDNLPPNQFINKEELGIRDFDGLPAHGVRETQTIAAENSGMGKEIMVTDEYWYSDDLRINLMINHIDPRTGTVTMTVTQISRTEPDSALFKIPEGYKQAAYLRAR